MADETPNDPTPEEELPAADASAPAEEPEAAGQGTGLPTEDEAAGEQPVVEADARIDESADEEDEEPAAPRVKPAIPGADLEVDIVVEGQDPLSRDPYAQYAEVGEEEEEAPAAEEGDEDVVSDEPIAATIELAADARYRATGKRKSAIARVTLRPGTGVYLINGRELDVYFPRDTLGRTIRQPLEAVGFETRMDVVARIHGGGVASQAGALRHGISRALLEADPNLRGELKRRGFLTRDARVKERKKAGLKKARKRPQFSKR